MVLAIMPMQVDHIGSAVVTDSENCVITKTAMFMIINTITVVGVFIYTMMKNKICQSLSVVTTLGDCLIKLLLAIINSYSRQSTILFISSP